MTLQAKKIVQEPKPLFAGIDVGAEELILVIRNNGTPYKAQKFANTPTDRARLGKKLVNLPGILVCLEATGVPPCRHRFASSPPIRWVTTI